MSSVVMCNMHNDAFDAYCRLFEKIGITVYCPVSGGDNYFRYNGNSAPSSSVNPYAKEITKEQCLDMKPDFVLCCCWEQIKGATDLSKELGKPLVVRAGNNNVPYNKTHSKFLISNDTETMQKSSIENKLFLMLPTRYDFWIPIDWNNESLLFTSFIHYYMDYWKESFKIYEDLRNKNRSCTFVNFGSYKKGSPYNPLIVRGEDLRDMMRISRAVIHIKEKEGYGWTLIKAISCGIPVIAYKPYVVGKTCEKFLIEGKTCAYINNISEFNDALKRIEKIHNIAPEFIRNLISLESESEKLKKFLEKVI